MAEGPTENHSELHLAVTFIIDTSNNSSVVRCCWLLLLVEDSTTNLIQIPDFLRQCDAFIVVRK